jgi:hypothetical protein
MVQPAATIPYPLHRSLHCVQAQRVAEKSYLSPYGWEE